MTLPTLWLDDADAKQIASQRAANRPDLQRIAERMIEDGFVVLPQLVPDTLCDAVVSDFRSYVTRLNADQAEKALDKDGRYLRLVNLHTASTNALALGLQPGILEILDFLFGYRAAIYTSLYFEYGTQQAIHRDSPFFETFPRNYFLGIWTALEDIEPDSGPLMYIPGGHRFTCDPHEIYDAVRRRSPDLGEQALLAQSLETYYGCVIETSKSVHEPVTVPLKKGDVAIWHPALPHGGSPAANPSLTRRSIVFHCAPEVTQVYQHQVFFTHRDREPPAARYGFAKVGNRKVAETGYVGFQS